MILDYSKPTTPSEVCEHAERLITDQINKLERTLRHTEAKVAGLNEALDEVRSMGMAYRRHQPKPPIALDDEDEDDYQDEAEDVLSSGKPVVRWTNRSSSNDDMDF